MKLATVIGRVTLSQQEPSFKGGRFLVAMPVSREQLRDKSFDQMPKGNSLVVYDNLGAGVGDLIGYTDGAEATAAFDSPVPLDAYNCAIIDETFYNPPKSQDISS